MTYIFAPSYQTIIFSLHQFRLDEITYVTLNPSIKEFAERIGIPVIYREEQTDLTRKGYKEHKEYCLDMIKDWKGRDILFCFYTFDIWSLYQLLKLRKNNKVYFSNTDYATAPDFEESTTVSIPIIKFLWPYIRNRKYRNVLLRRILMKAITNVSFDLFKFDENYFTLGLSLNKCKKKFLPFAKKAIKNDSIYLANSTHILDKFSVKCPDILLIDGGDWEFHYTAEIIAFFDTLTLNKNISFGIKPHPGFSLPDPLKKFNTLDKTLPIQLLLGMPKIVIGIFSVSLTDFSRTTTTISLVNLMKYDTPAIKVRVEKSVADKKDIICPANIEELRNVITKSLS